MTKQFKRAWNWSPAATVLGICLLSIWAFAVWSQQQNFPGGSGSSTITGTTVGAGPFAGVINIKAAPYNAFGDTQNASFSGASYSNPNLTCPNCTFTAADVGKIIWATAANGNPSLPQETITAFVSTHVVAITGGAISCCFNFTVSWGHNDDAAFTAAAAALNAQIAQNAVTGTQQVTSGKITATPTIYMPAGHYTWCTQATGVFFLQNGQGATIMGDGHSKTIIEPCQTYSMPNNNAAFIRWSNFSDLKIQGFTITGNNNPNSTTGGTGIQAIQTNDQTDDVYVETWGAVSNCAGQAGAGINLGGRATNVAAQTSCAGMVLNSVNTECYRCIVSNNQTYNLLILNLKGGDVQSGGEGFRWFGGLLDECTGTTLSALGFGTNTKTGCVLIYNSQDIAFEGVSAFGATGTTPAYAFVLAGGSRASISGAGFAGPFSGGGGAHIESGSRLEAVSTRFVANTGSFCVDNQGIFIDLGGNTCTDIGTAIAAVGVPGLTESVNTVTVTTTGVHGMPANSSGENCGIFYGNNIGAYSGWWKIASVPSTTTATYTNSTSGLANNGGGILICNKPALWNGNIPQASVTHSANSFFQAGTFAAINFGNQTPDQYIYITKIQAIDSNGATACTVAPVITFTQNSATATLTLTTAKSAWDSAVDASTSLPFLAVPGMPIVASATAGTCTTAPSNVVVTYTWQSWLQP